MLFIRFVGGDNESASLAKWSSLDLLTEEDGESSSPTVVVDQHGLSASFFLEGLNCEIFFF